MQCIGYWSWAVDPTRLVDPEWARGEREALAGYLRAGRMHAAYFGFSFCRFRCGIANHEMGSCDLTDGVWLWPEGLAHYVTVHEIALPDEFLAHVRRNGFVVPGVDEALTYVPGELPGPSDELWERWARERGASALDG